MTVKDYSKLQIVWTKHATQEALEDDFHPDEIKKCLGKVVEMPEFNPEKKRGIIRLREKHCTLIYLKLKFGLKIITCWKSSQGDIKDYKRFIREEKDG